MARWAYLAGMFITWLSQPKILQHLNDPCPKNIMNLGIKNEPVTDGADAIGTVISLHGIRSICDWRAVFMPRFRLFLELYE